MCCILILVVRNPALKCLQHLRRMAPVPAYYCCMQDDLALGVFSQYLSYNVILTFPYGNLLQITRISFVNESWPSAKLSFINTLVESFGQSDFQRCVCYGVSHLDKSLHLQLQQLCGETRPLGASTPAPLLLNTLKKCLLRDHLAFHAAARFFYIPRVIAAETPFAQKVTFSTSACPETQSDLVDIAIGTSLRWSPAILGCRPSRPHGLLRMWVQEMLPDTTCGLTSARSYTCP